MAVTQLSTTEQDTGRTWFDGSTIYSKVDDLGAATGTTELSVEDGWTIIKWSSIEADSGVVYCRRTLPQTGADYWEVSIPGTATKTIYILEYIKQAIV
jgi:hypothetical protein